jgi:hypothetical protein
LKKIIKKRAQESYLCTSGAWTARISEAASFEDVQDLIFISRHLAAIDIVYLFTENERGPLDLVLPLKE